ncbi:mannitol dehydrogenase family protein [Sphingomonas sp. H39-1-10]|uniref:mannitol dehydrogenase family protein n=1 Tax=Sphingomonas pollutisoli TaxID=3030829 RepID=UPI0023B90F3D|nr:mannitol dehydrogenase family protein [Sphingomonas pollutisoli]MDF0488210.1 mannitol dehydrogenase family protein [Sphingomonas pollutisoli]
MRLSTETLAGLPAEIARPAYDRSAVKRGVVHLGIGAFHRAHQAAYFEAALAAGDLRWGITSVSLRSGSVRDQLAPQDCLYALVVRDGDARSVSIIGAEQAVLVAPEDPAAVVAALAHPDARIVTLTITEKGYKLDRAKGTLLADDADVAADCASLAAPRTAPGFLAAGLAARRSAGLGPLTVISCDNLPHNGALLREAVLAVARANDPALAEWIAAEVAFPASMIDRIVPATTDADVAALAADLGVEDRAMVKTEPFSQWVIEDHFVTERPDFAALGVQLTQAVAPWEDAKLRLLNGAHSGIAYLGALGGDAFVHEFVATPAGRGFVDALWDEAQTTLDPPEGLDIAAYRTALMGRFANSALQHRTRQIAMDGSQKLPQRLLATIAERSKADEPVDALALAVAAWMRWQAGVTDAGETFTVDDPAAETLGALSAGAPDTAARVDALLGFFGFAADAEVRATLVRHLTILETAGARAAVSRFG